MPCDRNHIGCNVFDNLSFSVMVIDKDFNVISMNRKAEESLAANCTAGSCIKCHSLTHGREKR